MKNARALSLAILACTLLTLHNLHFYLDLMTQARRHIEAGDYGGWHRTWIERYETGEQLSLGKPFSG